MGHYTTCSICGVTEKGYQESCNCRFKRMDDLFKFRIGATLKGTFIKKDEYGYEVYEHWEKDSEDFFFCILLSDDSTMCHHDVAFIDKYEYNLKNDQ